jgi:hypothetical protein
MVASVTRIHPSLKFLLKKFGLTAENVEIKSILDLHH